jgi:hypothetical protein
VLHTGDFRAEPWFLDSIRHNAFLQPYLAISDSGTPTLSPVLTAANAVPLQKTLEAIFLDTACVMQTDDVPSKACSSYH